MVDLEIRHVCKKGRGVFAAREFRKNEFVCDYAGELLTEEQAELRSLEYDKRASMNNLDIISDGCYMFWFEYNGDSFCVDAHKEDGSYGRLINHSKRNANLRPRTGALKPRIMFYTTRRIAKGEELLYNYDEDDPDILKKFPWLAD